MTSQRSSQSRREEQNCRRSNPPPPPPAPDPAAPARRRREVPAPSPAATGGIPEEVRGEAAAAAAVSGRRRGPCRDEAIPRAGALLGPGCGGRSRARPSLAQAGSPLVGARPAGPCPRAEREAAFRPCSGPRYVRRRGSARPGLGGSRG